MARSRDRVANLAFAGLALGLAAALKGFYSRAGFDDLLWVLAPTAKLVGWLTGAAFEMEAHHGFVSRELRFEIVPSCSGLNFLIVAFVSLVCGLVHTRTTLRARLALVAISAVAAYGTTVLATAIRIAIAVRLHEAGTSLGPLTPARLHCAEGVVVYFLFLCAMFAVGERMTGAGRVLAL